jgi:ADP-ribose pyrophosphatase YjhB (NUDIX family)
MENDDKFNVVVLGIIYNPETKKILIGRRENDPTIKDLSWCFPGGRLNVGQEDIDKTLKKRIKDTTGYEVKNLGSIFSRITEEKRDLLLVYFLCETFEGEEKVDGEKLKELKWVEPKELETYFKTSFNTRLKEYIMNLQGSSCE